MGSIEGAGNSHGWDIPMWAMLTALCDSPHSIGSQVKGLFVRMDRTHRQSPIASGCFDIVPHESSSQPVLLFFFHTHFFTAGCGSPTPRWSILCSMTAAACSAVPGCVLNGWTLLHAGSEPLLYDLKLDEVAELFHVDGRQSPGGVMWLLLQRAWFACGRCFIGQWCCSLWQVPTCTQ